MTSNRTHITPHYTDQPLQVNPPIEVRELIKDVMQDDNEWKSSVCRSLRLVDEVMVFIYRRQQ